MGVVGLVVFVCLYFVEAGYGKMISEKWGPAINNKAAWVVMECPVFFVMLYLWATSERTWEVAPLVMFLIFQTHYFQRSFIFPMLLKGKSKMPIFIMLMGVTFNLINGYIQGYWIFYLSPADMYTIDWFLTPMFIIGTCIFIAGICINLHSDHVIRNLRKPGDTKHYLPKDGMYKYVCSANYFGE
ncbi:MAG: 3-oxo-5-alpha-steroid 4-dehydrogenase, partial [Paludibacteraceae bacterium]|nr:3-oxo-5-alpha-steroid 4-dehydrogenase [Paludibacteraceae bacterium]